MADIRLSEHLCKMRGTNEISPVYKELWNTHKFYAVIKGGKGSGKSYTIALRWIYFLMKYPGSNLLVIRKVFDSLRTSCYVSLQWAIKELGVESEWKCTLSPMQMTYKPTGQVILFKGCDKAEKIGSTNVITGVLCWCWFEEFYEISNEEEFNKIEYSIRGDISAWPGLWKQIVCSMNPWSETWIKKRFFDKPDPNVWNGTTTYRDNDKLDDDDVKRWEILYTTNPRSAKIVCDGEFGVAEGLVYTNWTEKNFDMHRVIAEHPNIRFSYGLDFGYAVSFNAFVAVAVDMETRELWVFDEMYDHGLPNIEIAKRINKMGYGKEQIWADAAEPKSIFELQTGLIEKTYDNDTGVEKFNTWVLPNIRPAMKGNDSVRNGIQNLQSFKMYIHSACRNTIVELNNYAYQKDKDGNFIDKPIKEFDHCLIGSTLIVTNEGEIPIKDIKNGNLVQTHLGLKKVVSAGITQFDQEIWELKLTDGTTLEGTWNHPVITVKGIKYLKDISRGDEVIKWVGQAKEITPMLNISNMMGYSGTGIQNQKKDQKENISSIITSDCTDMSGKNPMDQSQKDVISITLMEMPQIMTYQILKCSRQKNTKVNTQIVQNSMNGVNNISQRIKINAESGTNQKKDTCGINNMSGIISGQYGNSNVNNVGLNSKHKTMDTIDFAHSNVRQNGVIIPDSITRQEFVNSVVKNSNAINIKKQNFVLVSVESISVTTKKENVYDLTVEDAHDFFANGILVHNCMDSLRYAMAKFFVRARGHIAEARGIDNPAQYVLPEREPEVVAANTEEQGNSIVPMGGHKIRRVYSTH